MSVSYKKLWKLLIDKDMKKKDLCEKAGISPASVTKMGRNGHITTEILVKICAALDCGIEDKPYYGMTQNELKLRLGVDSSAKSLNEILLARMLDVKGRIACTEEFQKAGIIPKTIRVQSNGKIKESMSFPTFDFIALSKEETWEESELYNYLAPTKFMFVIFQERGDGA